MKFTLGLINGLWIGALMHAAIRTYGIDRVAGIAVVAFFATMITVFATVAAFTKPTDYREYNH